MSADVLPDGDEADATADLAEWLDEDVAPNKRAGIRVERAVAARVPQLGLVPDGVAAHYDAVATAPIGAGDLALADVARIDRGTPVEIKSVLARYADGGRGRYYLRPEQHDALVAAGGVYLLVVCAAGEGDRRDVLASKAVPAASVDNLLDADRWLDGGNGRSDYAQLSWTRFFDVEEVEDA